MIPRRRLAARVAGRERISSVPTIPQASAPTLCICEEAKRVSRVGAPSHVLWPIPLLNLFIQSQEKGEQLVHSQTHAPLLTCAPPQRCDGSRPTCSTCTRSKIHAECVYEDPPPESAQNSVPSSSAGSVVLTTIQDAILDTQNEAGDPTDAGDLHPPPRERATVIRLPSPVALQSFRPLLFTDHEDPLLYALSDISLEDMNMSL